MHIALEHVHVHVHVLYMGMFTCRLYSTVRVHEHVHVMCVREYMLVHVAVHVYEQTAKLHQLFSCFKICFKIVSKCSVLKACRYLKCFPRN